MENENETRMKVFENSEGFKTAYYELGEKMERFADYIKTVRGATALNEVRAILSKMRHELYKTKKWGEVYLQNWD